MFLSFLDSTVKQSVCVFYRFMSFLDSALSMTPETSETPHFTPRFTPSTTEGGSSSNNNSLNDGNVWSSLSSPNASELASGYDDDNDAAADDDDDDVMSRTLNSSTDNEDMSQPSIPIGVPLKTSTPKMKSVLLTAAGPGGDDDGDDGDDGDNDDSSQSCRS